MDREDTDERVRGMVKVDFCIDVSKFSEWIGRVIQKSLSGDRTVTPTDFITPKDGFKEDEQRRPPNWMTFIQKKKKEK